MREDLARFATLITRVATDRAFGGLRDLFQALSEERARRFVGWLAAPDGLIDEFDCRQALFGPEGASGPHVMWNHDTGTPILGLWDGRNSQNRARAFRERVQVVGFVHEEVFTDDEIREVTVLFGNPAFAVWNCPDFVDSGFV